MIRIAGIVLACSVLVPAAAGTSSTRSPVALTASPSRVMLAGTGRATIHIANAGSRPIAVDAQRAGFALDLRGRPRIVARSGPRAATSWLTVRPRRLVLRPGANASLTVACDAATPRRAGGSRRARAPHHAPAARRGRRRADAHRHRGRRPRTGQDRAPARVAPASRAAGGARLGRSSFSLSITAT